MTLGILAVTVRGGRAPAVTPDERPPRVPPFYADDRVTVHHGDCLDVLRTLPDCSVDSVVTDPPAAIAFMNAAWDDDKGGRDAWVAWLASVLAECRRILKPGGHALVWALPRTSGWTHRAIEDAGLDVRDCITHLFGSGFPKSLDVGKAIDRARDDRADVLRVTTAIRDLRDEAGLTNRDLDDLFGFAGMAGHWTSVKSQPAVPTVEQWAKLREALSPSEWLDDEVWRLNGRKGTPGEAWDLREVIGSGSSGSASVAYVRAAPAAYAVTAPATEDAARWDGFGTALKPASEMWYLARKPLAGTVAANVVAWGTGALNIAATRVGIDAAREPDTGSAYYLRRGVPYPAPGSDAGKGMFDLPVQDRSLNVSGRWPSNVVLTHAPDCEPVGTRKVRGSRIDKPADATPTERPWAGGAFHAPRPARGHGDEDGTETVEAWECAPGCPVAELDAQSGNRPSTGRPGRPARPGVGTTGGYGGALGLGVQGPLYSDEGGASRFFPTFRYQAKAPTRERPKVDGVAHPTCKPLALMRWLIRLVTPPGGVVLDPFAGSGTTAESAILEGFRCVTIEREADYLPLILARIQRQEPAEAPRPVAQQMSLLDDGSAA